MSEVVKWHELSNPDRIALLIRHVMKWPVVASLEGEHAECPIAWYCAVYQYWHIRYKRDGAFLPFDPLHRMDDAWLVVRKMNEPDEVGSCAPYAAFIDELEKIVGSNMFFDLFYCDPASDDQHLTPERLCVAALRAVGLEVVV